MPVRRHLPGPGRRRGGIHRHRARAGPRQQPLGRRDQPLSRVMAPGHIPNDTEKYCFRLPRPRVAPGVTGCGPVTVHRGGSGPAGQPTRRRQPGAEQAVRPGRARGGRRRPGQGPIPQVAAERGLVVEDAAGEFCGAVVCCEKDAVTLEDARGRRRVFPLRPGAFRLEGKPVMLVRPARPATPGRPRPGRRGRPRRTASGSIAAPPSRAKVAQASRIYVEGRARRRARREDLGR